MDLENGEFLEFTKCAHLKKLEYLIVGGFAMFLNGLNRATNDVDIWINPTHENGQRLVEVFRCMDLDESEIFKLEQLDFTEPQVFGFNGELDIVTRIHRNFNFAEVFDRSRSFVNGEGSTIYFLHLNDLRELKVLARRPQDLRDDRRFCSSRRRFREQLAFATPIKNKIPRPTRPFLRNILFLQDV